MTIVSPWLDVNTLPNCMEQLSHIRFDGQLILVQLPAGAFDQRTHSIYKHGDPHDMIDMYITRFMLASGTAVQDYFDANTGYTIFMQPNYPMDTIYQNVNNDNCWMKNMPPDGKCVRVSRILNK